MPRKKTDEQITDELMTALTDDYKGRRTDAVNADGQWDWRFYTDIDRMCCHPFVANCLRIYEAGLALSEVEVVDASSSAVGVWALKEWQKFWELHLHLVQRGDRYGWIGGELIYDDAGGELTLDRLRVFHPFDTKPLKMRVGSEFAGVRVKNLERKGELDLKPAGRWPGKAFWYGHETDFHRFYGYSQLRAAHRSWQQLAERQGVEEIIDIAITRTGVPGPKMRFPEDAIVTRDPTTGALTYDAGRQKARKIIEDWMSGMYLLLSSKKDEKGDYLWDAEWPEAVLNVDPLISRKKDLHADIAFGIGAPQELVETLDTGGLGGGGVTGRNVTMETFLNTQQRVGRAKTLAWYTCYAQATAKFNFGPDARFTLRMKPLIQSRNEINAGTQGAAADPYIGADPAARGTTSLPGRPQPQPRPEVPGRQRLLLSTDDWPSRTIRTRPTLLATQWEEGKHPRRDDGKFGQGRGNPASDKPATAKGQKQSQPAASGVRLATSKQRAFTGEEGSVKTKISKQEAGKIGEDIVVGWLRARGMADARPMNLDRNNFPIDLIQDHETIEVKTGQAGNSKGAQQWRLTIGEPGKAEKEWLMKATPEEKAKWNAKKQKKIHERKQKVLNELGKVLGHKVKAATVTVILNPDTRTADIFKFSGWHDRIAWTSPETTAAYQGSFRYA